MQHRDPEGSHSTVSPVKNPAHLPQRGRQVTVHIPGPLRQSVGRSELSASTGTVRSVLAELERRYPELHQSICDETGTVRRHINVFVNTNHMRDCAGLDTILAPGDEVTILPAVSGG